MKPIALFILMAVFSLGHAHAKTVTTGHRTANEQSVVGVAGPPPPANKARIDTASDSSAKGAKKAKAEAKPARHDSN